MPCYLNTSDVLNIDVSCFANYDTPSNPKTVNLLTWLQSGKYHATVERIRATPDKAERDAIKATLPAITPSGLFTYRKESDLVPGSHTRLIQFDIDGKDNKRIRNYADLKAQIANLPFVAYCGQSASGKGYWGLVPIAHIERHSQHFDALVRVFARFGISIDSKPRNVASLRGYSYDDTSYQPERVMVFELYDEPPKPTTRPFEQTADADTERKHVEVCIAEVVRRGAYLGDSYGDWYSVGCGFANTFGEGGRDYFHMVSQHYATYKQMETDKQFSACLRGNSKATLSTFFHLCQEEGIKWKDLIEPQTYRQPARSQPGPSAPTTKPVSSPPSPAPIQRDGHLVAKDTGATKQQTGSVEEPPVSSQPLASLIAAFDLVVADEDDDVFLSAADPIITDPWGVAEIAAYFATATLPESFRLTQAESVGNTRQFVDSHLSVIQRNNGTPSYLPYLNRLQSLQSQLQSKTHLTV